MKEKNNLSVKDISMKSITVKAPINIAVIKYWGKSDEELILPLNNSISVTLSIDQLCSFTTVAISKSFVKDRFWLNGKEVNIEENKRLNRCLKKIREISSSEKKIFYLHICSQNNFPTAAGLASSASGYAGLVFSVGHLLEISDLKQLSIISRFGSGSACRSLFGGFAEWISKPDSDESYAKNIADELHWPEMKIVILITNNEEKDVSSTKGMKLTVETSTLFKHRIESVVGERAKEITKAIKNRDFHNFAELTMKDSNQFHAICQDSYPPIRYMNDISWSIVKLIHNLNEYYNTNKFAYTFDAGPNACVFMLENDLDEFLTIIDYYFPNNKNSYHGEQIQKNRNQNNLDKIINNNYYRGLPFKNVALNEKLLVKLGKTKYPLNSLKGIISTKIGTGPKLINDVTLLNENGLPINELTF